jgi:hypothetical protein
MAYYLFADHRVRDVVLGRFADPRVRYGLLFVLRTLGSVMSYYLFRGPWGPLCIIICLADPGVPCVLLFCFVREIVKCKKTNCFYKKLNQQNNFDIL